MPQLFNALLLRMQQTLSASVTPTLASTQDDDISGEADEPPDEPNLGTLQSHSDTEFVKHSIKLPPTTSSLLTEALLFNNPQNRRINFSNNVTRPEHSTSSSYWSLPSNNGLTSDDGMSTNCSRSPSPRPHPPMVIPEIIFGKPNLAEVDRKLKIVEPQAEFPRKRAITFACSNPPSRRNSNDTQGLAENVRPVAEMVRKPPTIKFACGGAAAAQREQRPAAVEEEEARPSTPIRANNKLGNLLETPRNHNRRDSQSTVTADSPRTVTRTSMLAVPPKITGPKFYEFASSCEETEEWMLESRRGRLLKVDDVLEKERKIQKLSREVEGGLDEEDEEGNVAEEEEDGEEGENEEMEDDEEELEEEEDEEEDQDDEDEDELEGGLSGNESDIEDGFASDSDDGSIWYFGARPSTHLSTFTFSRRSSASHHSEHPFRSLHPTTTSPLPIRPSTPDLPDSTDFVCGTLDEDRPLEEAYMQSVESRRAAKRFLTPQDIDPSFPESEPEEEDDDEEDYHPVRAAHSPAGSWIAANMSSDGSHTGYRSRCRSPPPATTRKVPSRRNTARSPAPSTRRMASPPPPVRRNSRHLSPLPTTRLHHAPTHLSPRAPLPRTKSLPRPTALFRLRKTSGRNSAATSPSKRTAAVPIRRARGAQDIVQGLERKKERRRDKRKREEGMVPGLGEERMRNVGLGVVRGPVEWVISV